MDGCSGAIQGEIRVPEGAFTWKGNSCSLVSLPLVTVTRLVIQPEGCIPLRQADGLILREEISAPPLPLPPNPLLLSITMRWISRPVLASHLLNGHIRSRASFRVLFGAKQWCASS